MIITDSKPYGLLKSQIKKQDKISILSCNSCVTKCETGGEKKIKQLSKRLKKNGYNVIGTALVGMACDFDLIEKQKLKGNIIIVLSCKAGVYNVKKHFPKKKIIEALDTIGLGAWDEKGNLDLVQEF